MPYLPYLFLTGNKMNQEKKQGLNCKQGTNGTLDGESTGVGSISVKARAISSISG